jgi:peptidoglycan/LPS O-acetylase OafA/YrhL
MEQEKIFSENEQLVSRGNTQFLTGIRGYAALGVVLVHCSIVFRGYDERIDHLINLGKHGVVAFFVLSAFSLAISMSHNPLNCRKNIAHYFSRRFWRIMPLYVLMCVVCAMIPSMGSSSVGGNAPPNPDVVKDVLMHVTLLNIFNHQYANSIISVEWTIQLEMFAYLLLPVLFIGTKNQKWKWGLLLTLIFYIIGKQGNSFERLLPEGQTFYDHDWSIFKYFFAFYAGTLAFNRISTTRFKYSPHMSDAIVFGLVAFLFLFAVYFPTSERLIVTLWVIAVIYALLKATGRSRCLFENKVILHIGKISFSIYLIHMPLYRWVMPRSEVQVYSLGDFLAFFLLLMVGSTFVYWAVEAPCIRYGELLFKRMISKGEKRKRG